VVAEKPDGQTAATPVLLTEIVDCGLHIPDCRLGPEDAAARRICNMQYAICFRLLLTKPQREGIIELVSSVLSRDLINFYMEGE
jgi:hypothetical protein